MNELQNPLLHPRNFSELPPLLQQLEDAIDNPESSFEDIAGVVESDERLATRLLNLANSYFYNYPLHLTTIPDALSVIGLRNVWNLSTLLTLPEVLTYGDNFPVPMREFWKYSIAVGLCSRLIGLETREANTERHFTAGFLHKIGRPLMANAFPEKSSEIHRRISTSRTHYAKVSQSILGIDEAEFGAAAMQHWHFQENVYSVVRYHNKPVLARKGVRSVSIVHVASFLVSALRLGDSGDRFVPEFSEAAWGYAGLAESKLVTVCNELGHQLENVCKVFLDPV